MLMFRYNLFILGLFWQLDKQKNGRLQTPIVFIAKK